MGNISSSATIGQSDPYKQLLVFLRTEGHQTNCWIANSLHKIRQDNSQRSTNRNKIPILKFWKHVFKERRILLSLVLLFTPSIKKGHSKPSTPPTASESNSLSSRTSQGTDDGLPPQRNEESLQRAEVRQFLLDHFSLPVVQEIYHPFSLFTAMAEAILELFVVDMRLSNVVDVTKCTFFSLRKADVQVNPAHLGLTLSTAEWWQKLIELNDFAEQQGAAIDWNSLAAIESALPQRWSALAIRSAATSKALNLVGVKFGGSFLLNCLDTARKHFDEDRIVIEIIQTLQLEEIDFPLGAVHQFLQKERDGLWKSLIGDAYNWPQTTKTLLQRLLVVIPELGADTTVNCRLPHYGSHNREAVSTFAAVAKGFLVYQQQYVPLSVMSSETVHALDIARLVPASALNRELLAHQRRHRIPGTAVCWSPQCCASHSKAQTQSSFLQSLVQRAIPNVLSVFFNRNSAVPTTDNTIASDKGGEADSCLICQDTGSISNLLSEKLWQQATAANITDATFAVDSNTCSLCYARDCEFGMSPDCEHRYCGDCVDRSLKSMLQVGQFPAFCPQCRAAAPAAGPPQQGAVTRTALAFLLEHGVINASLHHSFVKAMKREARNCTDTDQPTNAIKAQFDASDGEDDFFVCPAGCGSYLAKPANCSSRLHVDATTGHSTIVTPLGVCPCAAVICIKCRKQVHASVAGTTEHECDSNFSKLSNTAVTSALEIKNLKSALGAKGRECPACGLLLQKNEGCSMMTCGSQAHGKLSDALRNGGCGISFNWDTMKVVDGFKDVDGIRRKGRPVTARQLKNHPKCKRTSCPYYKSTDGIKTEHALAGAGQTSNKGGDYCCSCCAAGTGHGTYCHRIRVKDMENLPAIIVPAVVTKAKSNDQGKAHETSVVEIADTEESNAVPMIHVRPFDAASLRVTFRTDYSIQEPQSNSNGSNLRHSTCHDGIEQSPTSANRGIPNCRVSRYDWKSRYWVDIGAKPANYKMTNYSDFQLQVLTTDNQVLTLRNARVLNMEATLNHVPAAAIINDSTRSEESITLQLDFGQRHKIKAICSDALTYFPVQLSFNQFTDQEQLADPSKWSSYQSYLRRA